MAYQFAHLETYSRKPNKEGVNTQFVFDEASRREPSACRHVQNPQDPGLVYGMDISDLEKLHNDMCDAATTTNANGQTRKIRKDQHTLATVVLSYPEDPEPGTASYQEWEKRSVNWLKEKYGDDLKTVIRHTDEAHPHIHAYILPDHARAKDVHPGYSAKTAVMDEAMAGGMSKKAANKESNSAYREAMREWQDSYYEAVGRPCGLTRIGPGKRRLTRSEYTKEKAQEKRNREAVLLQESARRLDIQTRAEARKVAEKSQILEEEVGDGWLANHARAKKLAELTAVDILEDARRKGMVQGAKFTEPQFNSLREKAKEKVSILAKRNTELANQNVALLAENRQISAGFDDYQMHMARTELIMTEAVHGLRDVAYESRSPKAYERLSRACENVHDTHEADPSVFGTLIKDVRQICRDVKEFVPSVFKKFFGWTPEQKAEKEAREREVERIKEEAKRAARTAENSRKSERKSPSSPSPLSR